MTNAKAARIKPDSRSIAYGAAGLAIAIYMGAFGTSFFGQASLAAHMQIPTPMTFVVPVVVDLALVLFTLATLVRRSRNESTVFTNAATAFWTLVSICANVLHILVPAGDPSTWAAGIYAGSALSALMPLAALGSSLIVENILIEPAAAEQPAPEPLKVAESVPVRTQSVKDAAAAPLSAVHSGPMTPKPTAAQTPKPVAVKAAPVISGHSAPEGNWSVMSKEERADKVQELGAKGLSIPKIAHELGTSESTVKRVRQELQAA